MRNESFHSVILPDYRSGYPYRENDREGERRRSEVTEVSLSSAVLFGVQCAAMATLKRHRYVSVRAAQLHTLLLCETECEGTCMSSLCVIIRPDLTH